MLVGFFASARLPVDGLRHVILQVELLWVRDDVSVLFATETNGAHKVNHKNLRRCLDGPRLLRVHLLVAPGAHILVFARESLTVHKVVEAILKSDFTLQARNLQREVALLLERIRLVAA